MIPKIIHYCWFGRNPLPPLAEKCIASWRKFLPDYEIWQWEEAPLHENENKNQNRLYNKRVEFDVNMIPYTTEAYRQGKYAFVSDYARFWILYKYGGLYFDTDVEVIRPMDDIIAKGAFMGFETDPDGENSPLRYPSRYAFGVNVGLGCGFEKENDFVKRMLEVYGGLIYEDPRVNPNLKTVVAHVTEALMEKGLECKRGIQQVDGITIYPREYFAPINVVTGRLHITENTRAIHQYMGSWKTGKGSWKECIRRNVPEWCLLLLNRIKRRLNRQ